MQTSIPLPLGALVYFVELRAAMHGLVMLELLGQLQPFVDRGEELYLAAMQRSSDDIDAMATGRGSTGRGKPGGE